MSTARFKLDMFEGPLDLLLHLISKHKLNIHDIQISLLLEQYLEYIHQLEHEDLEDAADFLEMAARLIYIKTVSLLPVYEEAKQLKEELTGELLEYRDCKLMAQKLAQQANGFDYYCRTPMELPADHTYRRVHEGSELLESYINAIGRGKRKLPPPIEAFQVIVSKKIVSVSSRIYAIYRKLRKTGKAKFAAFFEGATSRSQLVATFLALLELMKANRVTIDDDETVILHRGKREKE